MNYAGTTLDEKSVAMQADKIGEELPKPISRKDNEYWEEKSLLKVLLKREHRQLPTDIENADHLDRRAMIFILLGMKAAATETLGDSSKVEMLERLIKEIPGTGE